MRFSQYVACLVAAIFALVHANVGFSQKLDSLRLMPCGGMSGSEVAITLPGKFESWPIGCWSSHPGIAWRATETSGNVTATIAPEVPLGIHWVRFYTDRAASPLLRFVVGDITEVTEVEPNNRYDGPQRIEASNVTINGVLQKSGDVDHFSRELKQGERWCLDVDANRSLKSPMDACLQILDLRGNVLAQNLDHFGLDPALQWVCPRDGVYAARIFAFPESPDSTIGYAGGDAYRYRIRSIVGEDPTWSNRFTHGAQAIEEPNNRTMPLLYAPKVAGTFHVPSALTNSLESDGNQIAFFGRMESRGDEDAVQFETTVPGHWKIQLRARELGSSMDAVIEILDATGKSLAKQGESGEVRDPILANQLVTPGTYTIIVRDLHQQAGPDVAYRLELDDEVPSVKGTLPADILVGEVGKPIDVEVPIDRTFECADEVLFSVIGLPEGVTCEPVASKSTDDSAKKVLLKILATKNCSVPVRIACSNPSQPQSGFVTATNTQEPDLWLIVSDAK